MSLDDMLDGAKRDYNEFLGRNGNLFFALAGAAIGAIDGLRIDGPPDPTGAFINSAFWFWFFWPTAMGVYACRGIPNGPIARHLYLSQGPENTIAFTVPYLGTATIAYMLRTSV